MAVAYAQLLSRLGELAAESGGRSDAELLARFYRERDEAAFELIVRRHGALVWRVCRARLANPADAEDVFQATFLALARAARRIREQGSLAGWLYRVAIRLTGKLRARTPRVVELPAEHPAVDGDPAHLAEAREQFALLCAEIDRLPRCYRDAVLLCLVEGKSHRQAARELNCPGGTIDSRLAWARARLRERLIRRGIAPAAVTALLAAFTADAVAIPPNLAESIAPIALLLLERGPAALAGSVSPRTADLLQSVGPIMTRTKTKLALTLALFFGVIGIAMHGWLDRPASAENPPSPPTKTAIGAGEWRYVGSWRVGRAPVTCLVFAPGGRLLLTNGGSVDSGEIRFLSIPSGELTKHWIVGSPLKSAAISPDGKLVATTESHGLAIVRAAETGSSVHVWDVSGRRVDALAFSPDGKRLALASGRDALLWPIDEKPEAARLLKVEEKTPPEIAALTFTPDGKRLLVAGDGAVRIWDVASGKIASESSDWSRGRRDVAVSPDGKLVAVAGLTDVKLIDTISGKVDNVVIAPPSGGDRDICAVGFADNKTLAVGCNPFLSVEPAGVGSIRLFDISDGAGKKIGELKLPSGFVVKVAVSQDGKYLAVGAHDGVVHLWERATTATTTATTRAADRLDKLIDELAGSNRSGEQCVDSLFLASLGRFPSETERQFAAGHVGKIKDRREALRDLLAQLTATREFREHVTQLQGRERK